MRNLFFTVIVATLAYASLASAASPAIQTLCGGYRYLNDQQSCYTDLANIEPAEGIVKICSGYRYLNDQRDCYKDIGVASRVFADVASQTCSNYRYLNDQKDCAKRLVGLVFDDAGPTQVCTQYRDISARVNCLAQLGTPARRSHQGREIRDLLQSALQDIDSGHLDDAKESIQSALDQLHH